MGVHNDRPAAPVRRDGQIVVYDFGKIEIATDERLTERQARRIARHALAAYEQDYYESGRGRAGPGAPLTIGVFSDQTFAEFTGDRRGRVFGVQTDRNTIVMRDDIVRGKPRDLAVLAHEVSHVQDERQAGGERVYRIPSFLREGKAVVLGNRYVASRGLTNGEVQRTARELGGYTAEQASETFRAYRGDTRAENRSGNGKRHQQIGALYVEFLRTRLGGGHPDALASLSRIAREVGTKGKLSFDAAFQKHFGVPPAEAEAAFVQFMSETQGNPAERLRGTIYEPR
jgi:hypothetical protein